MKTRFCIMLISALSCFALVCCTATLCAQTGSGTPGATPASETVTPLSPAAPSTGATAAAPAPEGATITPTQVEVGLYLMEIAKLDMKQNEFFADFYIWYKVLEKGAPWSPDMIEFSNGTLEFSSPPASATLSDGRVYWSQRVKGRFRGQFNLHSYPFDSQTLPLVIEDRENPAYKVQLVPDPLSIADVSRWMDPGLQIPDWKTAGAHLESDLHVYQTDFGLAEGAKNTEESKYSRITYSINIHRLFIPHMIKFMIPLLVIAGMAYMVFFINANEFESQCAICVTSLLSAVALHISQADALPAVGYLVVADKIFILFYLVIFSALVQTVIANHHAAEGDTTHAVYLDQVFRVIYPLSLVLGSLFIVFTSVH